MGGVVVFCLMTLRGYGVIVFWVLMRLERFLYVLVEVILSAQKLGLECGILRGWLFNTMHGNLGNRTGH
ncbi:hypothetical protein BDV35DRAFT_339255 [Aspergillus flavus]|uniref:Uncharacterized protein n=1 Tax=Aspergillus flavus TaxID=5059 RepID=A0A5N6HG44_ASPFL|nr:hypothetical protein BDV35DRAFT_339255 [Aspergillus flavus]